MRCYFFIDFAHLFFVGFLGRAALNLAPILPRAVRVCICVLWVLARALLGGGGRAAPLVLILLSLSQTKEFKNEKDNCVSNGCFFSVLWCCYGCPL